MTIKVGDTVNIRKGLYKGHYGVVVRIEDGFYHVNGGSISLSDGITPVFGRSELSAKPKRFRAVCLQCYTCYLTQPVSKKEAELAAVSHMNAYKHRTTVQEETNE